MCFWLRCSGDVNNRWLNCCANVWGTLTFIAVLLAIAGGVFAKQFVADFIPAVIKKMEVSMEYFNGGGFMPKTGDLVGNIDVEAALFKNLNFCEEDPDKKAYSFLNDDAYAKPLAGETNSVKDECKAATKCDDLKKTPDYPGGLLIPAAVATSGASSDSKDDINLYTNCKDAIAKAKVEQTKAAAEADKKSEGATANLPRAPVSMGQIKSINELPVGWMAFGLCVVGALIVFIALLLFCCELRTQIKSDDKGACCGIMCCVCCPFWFTISTVLSVIAVVFFFIQGVVYSQPFEIVGMLAGDSGFDPMAVIPMVQDLGKQLAATKEEERLCTDPDTFFAISEVNCLSAEKSNMFDKIQAIMDGLGDDYKGIKDCNELSLKCKELAASMGKIGDVEIKFDEKTADEIDSLCDNLFVVPMGDKLTEQCDTFVSAFYFAVTANVMLASLSLWGILLALWTGCKACCGDKHGRNLKDDV